jgi:hypothetical protein
LIALPPPDIAQDLLALPPISPSGEKTRHNDAAHPS